MMTRKEMKREEVIAIVEKHEMWLTGDERGERVHPVRLHVQQWPPPQGMPRVAHLLPERKQYERINASVLSVRQ